jgi:FdhE protein
VLRELDEAHWDAIVAPASGAAPGVPRALQSALPADPGRVLLWYQSLRRAAIRSELPKLSGWSEALSSERGAMSVFAAALSADDHRMAALARTAQVDAEAFTAVAGLLPFPFLQACRRAGLRADPTLWSEGYCPCCGAWPVCAEICGIERDRYLRCVRCASAWRAECLRCAYCGNRDHEQLGSLLAESGADAPALETCAQCMGYMKVFHRLVPSQPAELLLSDLASVDFDVAAANRGYRRPRANLR